jgi:hypothetical protein
MYEVRCKQGKLMGSYLTKEEAIERMNAWPQAHYVVEVYEVRNLVAVRDEQGGSREASVEPAKETYF